jgi:hypothetical protein
MPSNQAEPMNATPNAVSHNNRFVGIFIDLLAE